MKHGANLVFNSVARGKGAPVGFERKGILIRARYPELSREQFGRVTHVQAADRIGKSKQQAHSRLKIRRTKRGHQPQPLPEFFGAREAAEFLRRLLFE